MKIIKIESCIECHDKNRFAELISLECPMILANYNTKRDYLNKIHPDCPLEDYQETEWKKPGPMLEFGSQYWVLCIGNQVEKAYFESNSNKGAGYCFTNVDGDMIENITLYAEYKKPDPPR